MAESPIINTNPEKLFSSLLSPAIKRKNPITSSSNAAGFNHKHLTMMQVAEKSFNFTACKTQNQITENLVLKSSGLIIFGCRNHIVTKNSNLDYIFLFLFEAAVCDTNTSIFHLQGSTFLCFEIGRLIATLVPRISTINPPVRKVAGAQSGAGNAPHQHGVQPNQNINMVEDDANHPDNVGEGGNNGGDGNGNDGNNDGGNGEDDDDEVMEEVVDELMAMEELEAIQIKIYRVDVNVNNWMVLRKPPILTELVADDYESWEELARAVHDYFLTLRDDNVASCNGLTPTARANLNPRNCWPGSVTVFGYEIVNGFQPIRDWQLIHWANIRHLLNGVVVIRAIH